MFGHKTELLRDFWNWREATSSNLSTSGNVDTSSICTALKQLQNKNRQFYVALCLYLSLSLCLSLSLSHIHKHGFKCTQTQRICFKCWSQFLCFPLPLPWISIFILLPPVFLVCALMACMFKIKWTELKWSEGSFNGLPVVVCNVWSLKSGLSSFLIFYGNTFKAYVQSLCWYSFGMVVALKEWKQNLNLQSIVWSFT